MLAPPSGASRLLVQIKNCAIFGSALHFFSLWLCGLKLKDELAHPRDVGALRGVLLHMIVYRFDYL